jgi:hypothetical protein
MSNLQKLKLIEGQFSPKDSREILMNIFSSKIQFHQLKNFGSQERLGKEDKMAITRIEQLQESIEKLLKVIDLAEKEGKQLDIKSEVIIHFTE